MPTFLKRIIIFVSSCFQLVMIYLRARKEYVRRIKQAKARLIHDITVKDEDLEAVFLKEVEEIGKTMKAEVNQKIAKLLHPY